MKIVSFNIQHGKNYITKEVDLEGLASFISRIDADIYVINEIFGGPIDSMFGDQVATLQKLTGLYTYFGKAIEIPKGNYGNAILAKHPIISPHTFKIEDPVIFDEDVFYESRVITKAQINGLTVFATHLGLAKKERENGIKLLCELIKDEKNFVILGDFNMSWDDQLFDPLRPFVVNTLDDSYKTFPSDNPQVKIDYIFTSKDKTFTKADRINKIVSDHLPIYIEMKD